MNQSPGAIESTLSHMPLTTVSLSPALKQRVNELAQLRNGWLDGEGLAPSPAAIQSLHRVLTLLATARLPEPALFPSPEGHIEMQWSTPTGAMAAISHDGQSIELVYNMQLNQDDHLDHLPTQSDLAIVALFQRIPA
jgi:hypothetical protein